MNKMTTSTVGITFRIGKLVDGEVQWLTDEQTNLITDHGMEMLTRFPTASLHKYVFLGSDSSESKRIVDIIHVDGSAMGQNGSVLGGGDVGRSLFYDTGGVYNIISSMGPNIFTDNGHVGTYTGKATIANLKQDTLLDPKYYSNEVDSEGVRNEKWIDPVTGYTTISNVRCVRFPELSSTLSVQEIGWSNVLLPGDELNSKLIGRQVVNSVNFNVGDVPYIEVGIHKQFDTTQRTITNIPGYTGGGVSQCLLHLVQFDHRYYSTIKANGSTRLPEFNSLMEPYTVRGEDFSKFITIGHNLDYEVQPQSLNGYYIDDAQRMSYSPESITGRPPKTVAISETQFVVQNTDKLSLVEFSGGVLSIVAEVILPSSDTSGSDLLMLADGNLLHARSNELEIYSVGSNSLTSIHTHVIMQTNTIVLDSGIIVTQKSDAGTSASGDIRALTWNGVFITELATIKNLFKPVGLAPNVDDKVLMVSGNSITLFRVTPTSFVELVTIPASFNPSSIGNLSNLTRLNLTDYVYVGAFEIQATVIRVVGNSIAIINTIPEFGRYYGAHSLGEDNYVLHDASNIPKDSYVWHYDPTTASFSKVHNWEYALCYATFNKNTLAVTNSEIHLLTRSSEHRKHIPIVEGYIYNNAITMPSDSILALNRLLDDSVFVATDDSWIFLDLSSDDYTELAKINAIGTTTYAIPAPGAPTKVLITSDTFMYCATTSGIVESSVETYMTCSGMATLANGKIVASSENGHFKVFDFNNPALAEVSNAVIPATSMATNNSNIVALCKDTRITIVEVAGDGSINTIDTFVVSSNIGDIVSSESGFIFTTTLGAFTLNLTNGNWLVNPLTTEISSASTLSNYDEHLVVSTIDAIELYAAHIDTISRWGRFQYKAMGANPPKVLLRDDMMIIEDYGRLSVYKKPLKSSAYKLYSGRIRATSEDEPIRSLALSNNDAADSNTFEWILTIDNPMAPSNQSIFDIVLYQQWIRRTL